MEEIGAFTPVDYLLHLQHICFEGKLQSPTYLYLNVGNIWYITKFSGYIISWTATYSAS